MFEDLDCVVTFADCVRDLEAVETKLAARFNLTGNIRNQLIAMDRANNLLEDELVADWHDLYSSYMEWIRHG